MKDEIFNISDKKRLENYDRYLISLRNGKKGAYVWLAGKEPDLEKEIKNVEYKRKLLLERMGVTDMQKLDKWYQKWWGQIIIILISGLTLAFIVYKFGWNE